MNKYDVVIIGGGPAGLTAAVYTSRANLKTLFIEKGAPGGKIVKTFKIENWTGDTTVTGPQLAMRMYNHAKAYGATYKYGDVQRIKSNSEQDHEIILASGEVVNTKSVIIATGMVERIPEEIKGIYEWEHRGVSYCAICDGPLYKNKPMAFIGAGNSAVEEALFSAQFASHIYLFVRRKNGITAEAKSVEQLKEKTNVTILEEAVITEIMGTDSVTKVKAIVAGEEKEFEVNAVFPYIGQNPVSEFVKDLGITDERGFIITDESMETKIKGIYAVGDIRKKEIRQIVTAVADGAIAGKIITNRL